MFETTDDWCIQPPPLLMSPREVIHAFPRAEATKHAIFAAREQAKHIIAGRDNRLLVVIGPCSIHDPQAALEYAATLKEAIKTYSQQLHLVMRVYFEKPRTTVGWKGLINDPYLDNSHAINDGLMLARKLLHNISALNVPIATEFLDTLTPHYISDFVTWGAIGARTAESRIHRELASALPMAIGFKNNRDGNVKIAIDAVEAASHPHHFLSINGEGNVAVVAAQGNSHCHIILRGATNHSNYHADDIAKHLLALNAKKLNPYIMVDCSHGNSDKNHLNQIDVAYSLCKQISGGNKHIVGVMMESFLEEGKQESMVKSALKYGQSITDACLSWKQTLPLLDLLAESVEKRTKNYSPM